MAERKGMKGKESVCGCMKQKCMCKEKGKAKRAKKKIFFCSPVCGEVCGGGMREAKGRD